jgi:hypothetical protein
VHIRKEFTKTKTARDIYISDEATKYLKQWLGWKYQEARILKTGKRTTITPMPDDLVFRSLAKHLWLRCRFDELRSLPDRGAILYPIAC